MDCPSRLVGAKWKAKDDLHLKAPFKRILKELYVKRDFGKQNSHSIAKDIVLTNDYEKQDHYFVPEDTLSDDDLAEATLVSKDNVLVDGNVDTFHVSKYTTIGESKYVLEVNSNIGGQHPYVMGDKEELSPGHKEVKEVLRLFHEVCEELLKENRKAIMKKPNIRQFAAFILRDRHNWLNTIKILGSIPGVEVGDEFQFRAELCVIGLHQQFWKGIDYVEKDGIKLATSIVSSGRYPNFMNSSDVLIYSGEGGNPMVQNKWPLKDQVLKHGNLALKNNMERKTPVRVIFKICKSYKLSTYVYDGLYHVEKCWQERGKFGKLVFKFKLRRLSGQPKRTRGLIFRLDKYSFSSDGVLLSDSFENKKKEAVIVMNTLDYRRSLPHADKTDSLVSNQCMSIGCDCIDGCSDSEDCSCKIKNGKVVPYDYNECLVRRKAYIFECSPFCKCYYSCINRVSQRGIRFQFQLFMNKSRRWGIRSKEYIQAGSFICEYFGVKQAKEGKVSEIEHLFDMVNNKQICQNDHMLPLCNLLNTSFSKEDECLAIDVTNFENLGCFINHSYYPNLQVQKVFYGDSQTPHLMLFAMKDILPLRELTYDYKSRTKF